MSHIKMLGIHPVRTRLTQHSLVVRGRLMLNHFGYTYLKTENKNKLSIEGTWHFERPFPWCSTVNYNMKQAHHSRFHFYKCLNCLIDVNFSFTFKCHTFVLIPQEEKPLLFTLEIYKKRKKKSHCTVFINTDPKIFKTTKGDFGHQCVNVAIIQSWIPQSVVKPQPSKTVVHFITPRDMTLALCFYNSLFEYLFLTPDWYLEN